MHEFRCAASTECSENEFIYSFIHLFIHSILSVSNRAHCMPARVWIAGNPYICNIDWSLRFLGPVRSQTFKSVAQIACEKEVAKCWTLRTGLWQQSDHCSNLSLKIVYLVGLCNSHDLSTPQFPYLQSGSNNSHYYLTLQRCIKELYYTLVTCAQWIVGITIWVMIMILKMYTNCYGNLDEEVPTPPEKFFTEWPRSLQAPTARNRHSSSLSFFLPICSLALDSLTYSSCGERNCRRLKSDLIIILIRAFFQWTILVT